MGEAIVQDLEQNTQAVKQTVARKSYGLLVDPSRVYNRLLGEPISIQWVNHNSLKYEETTDFVGVLRFQKIFILPAFLVKPLFI